MRRYILYILAIQILLQAPVYAQTESTDSEESTDTALFRDPVIPFIDNDSYVAPSLTSSSSNSVGSPATSFSVSPLGGSQYSVALEVPQGVGGMQPSLSLSYDSQGGLGLAGCGVNISGLSVITRAPRDIFHDGYVRGLRHDDTDALCLDGRRLILVSGTDGLPNAKYHPEGDPYTTVTIKGSYSNSSDSRWMEVATPDGLICQYGYTADSRQSYVSNSSSRINAWYINEIRNPQGNYITYNYGRDNLYVYPTSITYGNNKQTANPLLNSVEFSYTTLGSAAQPFRLEGVAGQMNKCLTAITMKTGSDIYRSYALSFDTTLDSSGIKYPRLTKVEVTNGEEDKLPPVTFSWTGLPDYTRSVASHSLPLYGLANQTVYQFHAADLTGDGLSDIIEKAQSVDSLRIRVHAAQRDASGNISFAAPQQLPVMNVPVYDWTRLCPPLYMDFNGDGTGDLCMLSSDHTGQYHCLSLCEGGTFQTDSICMPELNFQTEPLYTSSDFDGDGYGDVFLLSKATTNTGYYQAVFIKGTANGLSSQTRQSYLLSLSYPPKQILSGDYNADGLEDLLVLNSFGYTIYWNCTGIAGTYIPFMSSNSFSDSYANSYISYYNFVYQGDFNGDGLTDLLMSPGTNTYHNLATSKGDGTFTITTIPDPKVPYEPGGYMNGLFVHDLDHDGRDDFVIVKELWTNQGYQGTYTVWMRNTGTGFSEVRRVATHVLEEAKNAILWFGDFDGDGYTDMMNYGRDLYSEMNNTTVLPGFFMYRSTQQSLSSGKIVSATDGYGNATSFSYSSLTRPEVYEAASPAAIPSNCMTATPPLHVLSSATFSNGVAGQETTSYTYNGLLLHRQGKGVLGYQTTSQLSSLTGRKAVHDVDSWHSSKFVPVQETQYQIQGTDTATVVNISNVTAASSWNGNYAVTPVSSTATDFDGYTVTTTWEYDTSKGLPTKETVTLDNANQYKETTYSYTPVGESWYPAMKKVIISYSSYAPVDSCRTIYSYFPNCCVQAKTENAQSTLALTTAYTYDNFGNVLTSVQTGQGISPVNTIHEYDGTHRFLTRTYTNPASTDVSYTYDKWGNLLTETDNTDTSNPLTVTHTYNGWGNRLTSTSPTGAVTEYHTGWGSSSSQKWFTVSQPAGGTWTKTWHDATGRETSTESKGMKNVDVTTSTTYDSRGRVLRKTSTEGTLTTWEEYGYDSRDRVASITRSTGSQTSYTYAPRKITEVTDGRTFEKYYDAWGNVTRIEDDEHGVSYSYRGDGKMTSALGDNRGGGGSYIGYDTAGNRNSLNDASAGTTSYAYNALGQITYKEDARGKKTYYHYDALNRLVSENADGDSVVYVYGTSGNSKGRLSSMTRGNRTISYAYDKYGRTVSETRAFGPGSYNSYTFRYSHDKKGRLTSRTFPSMYADSYVSDTLRTCYKYDGYGHLIGMYRAGEDLSAWPGGISGVFLGDALWCISSYDGQNTEEYLGDTIRRTTALNAHGYPQQVRMKRGNSTLRQMNYTYNAVTGNLTQRTSLFASGDPESFTYDSADRLTRWEQDCHAPAMEMTYEYNGNIYTKTNVGQYTYGYDWHRPFAVERVTNVQGLIPSSALSTEFDARGKISLITYYFDWSTLAFTYGPDGERWETLEQTHNYDIDRRFLGDMEVAMSGPGSTRCNWYLGHGVMMFRDTDNLKFSTTTPLYAYTDNQGSYIDFFRGNGIRVFEAKYDPWGVQTIVTDSIHFHRGYGGHEMLNHFGIINMGGRLYDPLLGRFLSPDNYVQEPFNTQNLNRYSYCLNNPVKYTDPDGEWFGLLPAIFGLGNMFAHHHTEGHLHLGHKLKYFAQGSLAGLAVNGVSQFGHYIPYVGKALSSVATAGMGYNALLGGFYGGRSALANWIVRGAKGFQLSKRIWLGQFYLNENFARGFWEGFGRYTWEFPQTAVGHLYNQDYNTVVGADRVDYLDGATFVTKYHYNSVEGIAEGKGVTIGNFININSEIDNIRRMRIQGSFKEYVKTHQLYMHEYGHYVDSHLWGPSYLFCIGIPSLYSAIRDDSDEENPSHIHIRYWTEKRANRRTWHHFHNHHGLSEWNDGNYPRW